MAKMPGSISSSMQSKGMSRITPLLAPFADHTTTDRPVKTPAMVVRTTRKLKHNAVEVVLGARHKPGPQTTGGNFSHYA